MEGKHHCTKQNFDCQRMEGKQCWVRTVQDWVFRPFAPASGRWVIRAQRTAMTSQQAGIFKFDQKYREKYKDLYHKIGTL